MPEPNYSAWSARGCSKSDTLKEVAFLVDLVLVKAVHVNCLYQLVSTEHNPSLLVRSPGGTIRGSRL